jgi:hypothetical protein
MQCDAGGRGGRSRNTPNCAAEIMCKLHLRLSSSRLLDWFHDSKIGRMRYLQNEHGPVVRVGQLVGR